MVANPDALHEMFIKSISGDQADPSLVGAPPPLNGAATSTNTRSEPPRLTNHGSST
jgi:hypothetical protein